MREYTFKVGPFFFQIHAEEDKEAVNKARRAIEESFPEGSIDHLKIELTAGAFLGRFYIEPYEININNICKKEDLPELAADVPF